MQSDNTNLFFPNHTADGAFSLMRLGRKSTKRENFEAKFENQSTLFKPNNF